MGEAKLKRRAHAAILAAQPWCIYCGGVHRAETIEHMPPIAMFDGRQRPKGLEFAPCEECNRGTRHSDLVASLMGRMYPDVVALGHGEFKRLLTAAKNNVPGLLQEMQIGRAGQRLARWDTPSMPPGVAVLRANGPILTRHMHVFGAKLGFALHFAAHGTPVPPQGGVQAMYFTNVNAMRGELPKDLINLLPATARTLKQGTREVGSQFRYSWRLTKEKRHSLFYAEFRLSFAVAAVTAVDRSEFLERNADKYPITIPGDFK